MRYVFDLDGTLCFNPTNNYTEATPLLSRIAKVNRLHDLGHSVIIHTARGMGSSDNNVIEAYNKWYSITEQQLKTWGVKYDLLVLGKPAGDLYFDDKAGSNEEFFGD